MYKFLKIDQLNIIKAIKKDYKKKESLQKRKEKSGNKVLNDKNISQKMKSKS